ncbi:Putative pyridoxine kinase, pyridoxamine kinase/Phosphomethylpyrimidine kinase, ribokinase [Colletotrichum destructivum]|uniref:pyridoxal kinase n=1 Tax=Colletotrichum destructivum TaxID=34406 RepID=A0AAX4I3P0_9PEZI|nr:Putative pyridoxine kinase, pyridoxamine kinase/Phosphomethylpyrimidine kinase, ribokinase [Colletotrichum destructivum]
MASELPIPDTRVLAVASHVVSGNVGNKIAVFTLQSLGYDVAALNTVQFSNHTGYRQWKGTRVSAQEIRDLFDGLKQSYLDDFDMMLSGYIPGAEAVVAVGDIAKELKQKQTAAGTPGNFFWVLDPVMGDNGRLYVAEEVVPAYQSLVEYADLILPNQFEAELLSGVKITDMQTLQTAIRALHTKYRIPHVVITSVSLASPDHPPSHLSVVGSSMSPTTSEPRLFKIVFPAIDAYFSGTGDMFAALMTVRMREAVIAASGGAGAGAAGEGEEGEGLLKDRKSWLSGDEVDALELPLAKAAEMVLASMHEVLAKTARGMQEVVRAAGVDETTEEGRKRLHLLKSKSAELKLVRNLASLREPVVEFRAKKL